MSDLKSARPQILVVDKDLKQGKSLANIIKRLDADILLALSAQEAIALAAEKVFALAIIEVELEKKTGFQLAIELRGQFEHMPIIFISESKSAEKFIIEGYVAGGVDYLIRPFNDYVLLTKVEVFLRLERQRLTLLQSNNDLKEFAHVASHDLKSPLNLILGFANLVESEMKADLTDTAKDYLGRIKKASGRMAELINDLLAYASIEAKNKKFEAIDLEQLFEFVLENFSYEIEQKKAQIHLQVKRKISGDFLLLKQLFENLIGNALKYCHPKRNPEIEILAEANEQWCVIKVTDNGLGFKQESVEKIFQPFQRLHTELPGSGLGLAIVKRVIDYHHGSIRVTSVEGEGSTFELHLPFSEESN